MKHKILFVDLDATLLGDDKTVSEKNKEAIRQMLGEGHYIVLATGRPLDAARCVATDLGLTMPGCYMEAFNGAILYDCAADRVLLKRSIPIEVVQELLERAKHAGIYVQTYSSTDILTSHHAKELDFYRSRAHIAYKISPNIMDILEEEPPKVMLIDLEDTDRLKKFQRENLEWTKSRCNSFFSSRAYLEYCPLHTSKATGVDYLKEILNMPPDCTIAVGDEQNDIPMIQRAHIGIAVKNALPEVKEAADYVTEHDNNHDAIAEVIEKFVIV